MKRLFASPWFWLPLFAVVALVVHAAKGDLTTRIVPDSASYLEFDASSLTSALSDTRTPGYPLFLKSLDAIGAGVEGAAFAHFVASVLAAVVFYAGLIVAGFRRPAAIAATGASFFTHGALSLLAEASTDSLAISLAFASTGCFFAAVSRRGGILAFVALAVCTFLTYQVRPAYLFLLPLWPTLGLALEAFLTRCDDRPRVRLKRLGGYLVVVALPFVLFCALRWTVVGRFGLVSFGGYNVVGIAGQFLDEPLAREMPEEIRPLAEEIVRRRPTVGGIEPPTDFVSMENSYNPTVWGLVVPTAKDLYGDDDVTVNDALSQLSGEILRRRPGSFARWLFWNAKHAVRQCLTLTVTDPAVLLSFTALLALHGWALVRAGRRRRVSSSPDDSSADPAVCNAADDVAERRRIEDHLLLWTAGTFAVAKVVLVLGVEPAIGRYMIAAIVLVPSAVAIWPVRYAERWMSGGSRQP